jgi:hypothetical protein
MTDIIQNGDFSYPTITAFDGTVNGIQKYNTFEQGEKDIFIWTGSDNLAVENNYNGVTPNAYPDITLLNIISNGGAIFQYVSFENTANIKQIINTTITGTYNLKFYYVSRPNYPLNNLQIFLNNELLDVITTTQANWTEYSYSFRISKTGIYTLLFQGQSDSIAIAYVRLFQPPSLIGTTTTLAYNNNFKSTIFNGFLKVIDISGTLGTLTSNYIVCNKNFTMPADGIQSIYFKDISSNIFGRIYAKKQMYYDYNSAISFRCCTNAAEITGNLLTITNNAVIVFFKKKSH